MTTAAVQQQTQDTTTNAAGRPAIRLAGSLHKLHYTDFDWSQLKGLVIGTTDGGRWPAGRNIAAAEEVQSLALVQFAEQGETILRVKQDTDLTPEAKSRRAMSAADTYVSTVGAAIKRLNDGMATLAEAAPNALSSVAPLDKGDVVAELRDQELRAIARGVGPKERQRMVMDISKGEHPELTAAILRGAAIASGMTGETLASISRVGIVASYRSELHQLRDLLMARDDVIRTAIAGINALASIDQGAQAASIRAGSAWRTDEGAEGFRAWLDSLIHG